MLLMIILVLFFIDSVYSNIDVCFLQLMECVVCVCLMVFDVDGVLIDGCLLVGFEGEISKVFDMLDGYGIKLLVQVGVMLVIISGW